MSVRVQIGGVSTAELHELELFTLQELDYKLCVSPDEVATRLRELKVLAHSRASASSETGVPLSSPSPRACMTPGASGQPVCAT